MQRNFIVNISHLSDGELEFFGWVLVDKGEEFSLYWNPRYNESQPVDNKHPRYLLVDDLNDAIQIQMGVGSRDNQPIIRGPSHTPK